MKDVPNILYDRSHPVLASYALSLINVDRSQFGLSPVKLSKIPCGQQHANSMLNLSYFSHWNNLGYKPYMRYTLMGGRNFVSENVAYKFVGPLHHYNLDMVKEFLRGSEYDMMYNDQEWQDGHRKNILDPYHNMVSLGIAHGVRKGYLFVYLVQDFEDHYVDLRVPFFKDGKVTLAGTKSQEIHPDSVMIYYDNLHPLGQETLGKTKTYDAGELLGGVKPPFSPIFFQAEVTQKATKWEEDLHSLFIEFSLEAFFRKRGSGVYTIYLSEKWGERNYTSLSIFA
jgi:uncharacterized protein YkwD